MEICFKTDNDDCNNNRDINYRTLEIIVSLDANEIVKSIKKEENHYGNRSLTYMNHRSN
jgi:hypothetical protein